MKYKIGERVKYDGGDWWFYGTVSAVFEHSICPCYRLSVERMEKKSCKFSITQFEYELEPYSEEASAIDQREWENSEIDYLNKYYGVLNNDDLSKMLKRSPRAIEEKRLQIKLQQKTEPEQIQKEKSKPEPKQKENLEPEPKQKEHLAPEPKQKEHLAPEPKQKAKPELDEIETKKKTRMRKTSDAWYKNFELYCKGKKTSVVNAWTSKNRKDHMTGILSKDKLEKLMEINFSFDSAKKRKQGKVDSIKNQKEEKPGRKRTEAWDNNFEAYSKGEKSSVISTWIAQNRKQYKEGKLSEEKFVKLMEINFPFEVVKKGR